MSRIPICQTEKPAPTPPGTGKYQFEDRYSNLKNYCIIFGAWSENYQLLILSLQSQRHSLPPPGYSITYGSKVDHPRLPKFASYHAPFLISITPKCHRNLTRGLFSGFSSFCLEESPLLNDL